MMMMCLWYACDRDLSNAGDGCYDCDCYEDGSEGDYCEVFVDGGDVVLGVDTNGNDCY
jgi:hypothetical protein